jgi:hypothetical protein
MTFFSAFILSFGFMLALTAVVAAWLFRVAPAPLGLKLLIPAALTAVACYTPLAVNGMMGLPVTATFAELPDRAELVAFVAHDDAGVADLWLRASDVPRAYETPLTSKMKQTLREAEQQMSRGRRVMLAKRGNNTGAKDAVKTGGVHKVEAPSIVRDDAYAVDENAFGLPRKEAGD